MMERKDTVLTVDAARGSLAVGVMLFHILGWQNIVVIPQLGTYGVYCFFVISGFCLYCAYRDRLTTPDEFRAYVLRRVFRIVPLLWVTIALSWLVYQEIDLTRAFLTGTLLFGFANPGDTSAVTGGWSMGIETVFYVALPLVILIGGKSVRTLSALTASVMIAQVVFINRVLDGTSLTEAWTAYTQPVAFGGYFVAGCLIAEVLKQHHSKKGSKIAILVASLALVFFAMAPLDRDAIITGGWGLILTVSSVILVAAISFAPEPKGTAANVAAWLGRLSYPVYLLHPIVNSLALRLLPTEFAVLGTIIGTLLFSEIISRWIETPAVAIGKRLTPAT